jgi:protocatechuate 3,4-dioxygenase beta subunit
MSAKQLVIALVLVGLLVAGVALLLLPEDEAAAPGAATAAQPGEPDALPTFNAEINRQAPAEPIEVPASPLESPERARARAARRDSGPHRTVSGMVVRTSDGTPLDGVTVAAMSREALQSASAGGPLELELPEGSPLEIARTKIENAEGRFELSVPVDTAALAVTKDSPWPSRSQLYDLAAGTDDVADLRFVFDSGFTVSGVVLDEGGSRLAGGRVEVNGLGETESDQIGEFTIKDVAPQKGVASVRVSARAPGHARGFADGLVPHSSSEVVRVELRLPVGGAIAGRITDARGEPLGDAQACIVFVMTSEHGSMAPGGLRATSDAHGEYLIDSVPPDRYIVEVGYGAGLAQQGGTFDGSFELDPGRPLGDQIVSKLVESKGLALRWFRDVVVVAGRTTRLDVTLYPPGVVAGRVVDDHGAAVADAKVTLDRIERWPAKDFSGSMVTSSRGLTITSKGGDGKGETELAQLEREVRTDAKGEYRFDKLMDGGKRLAVAAAGLVPQSLELNLKPAESLEHVDFVLSAGLSVSGRVRDPQGSPIEGADVEIKAIDESSFTGGEIVTDADGRFELTGLPPGPKQLLLFKTGYASVWKHVEPGQAEDLELTMNFAPKVIGFVTDVVGAPITNFDVNISYQGSSWTNSGGNYPDGRFEMPIDSDTRCTVTVRSAGLRTVVMEDVLPSRTAIDPLRFQLLPE